MIDLHEEVERLLKLFDGCIDGHEAPPATATLPTRQELLRECAGGHSVQKETGTERRRRDSTCTLFLNNGIVCERGREIIPCTVE